MARASGLHWVGVALLLIAACLLLVTSISSPVIGDIAILKVTLTNKTDIRHSSVTFGTFGHCVLDVAPVQTDQDYCFPKHIGYSPLKIMGQIDGASYSHAAVDSSRGLTDAIILHPIACAIAFLAFFASLGKGILGSLLGALLAGIAWIITLVVMAIDFALFGIVKDHVNKDGSGSHAFYSVGMWTCLAAMVLLFFAQFIVLFSCITNRRAKRQSSTGKTGRDAGYYESGYNATTTRHARRKRFGLF